MERESTGILTSVTGLSLFWFNAQLSPRLPIETLALGWDLSLALPSPPLPEHRLYMPLAVLRAL